MYTEISVIPTDERELLRCETVSDKMIFVFKIIMNIDL